MATIADVARAAGVSTSTVSYVLSGKRPISTDTRRRVERSIRRLGYHPNAGARALASSRTKVLALVVSLRAAVNVPVVMQFVATAVTSARVYDHDVLLVTKDEGPAGLRRVAGSAMVDAMIVMDIETAEPRIPLLRSLPCPAVLIGVPEDPVDLSCVDLDFRAAGALCVTHLAELGHRDIGMIGPAAEVYERGSSYADRFLRGLTSAADHHRVHLTTQPCEPDRQAVLRCVDTLLRRPDLSALVVHNESALAPLLSHLGQLGIRVPEDLSVVALCPDDMAEDQTVGLTSVAIPAAEVSRIAVELAMRQLAGETARETRLLAPRLTVRASTMHPRKQGISRRRRLLSDRSGEAGTAG
jgi:DNA-binding LacI/PurR family transcriptional regulator